MFALVGIVSSVYALARHYTRPGAPAPAARTAKAAETATEIPAPDLEVMTPGSGPGRGE